MLEGLLGNKSAEKVMLALYENGELHASAIAQIYGTALDPIKKQLERFEEAGFLVSRVVGRSRLYSFNEKHVIIAPLKELLAIAHQNEFKHKKKNIKRELISTREL
ncbi:MAG: winged helix-turn-helix transcriptional regulator [Rhizobacter sp.]|nr:winged helix-turn-helix transcriptional regulator [Bacteriovorax sp.]